MAVGIVSADHLSKWYGQVIGLNDVTLTIPHGITGLLGPNGAGKSTFMKLVTGQLGVAAQDLLHRRSPEEVVIHLTAVGRKSRVLLG